MPSQLDYVTDSVLVRFKTAPTKSSKNEFASTYGIASTGLSSTKDKKQLSVAVPVGLSVAGFIGELANDPTVDIAERNYIRQVVAYAVPPNDPEYANSAGYSTGSPSVVYTYGRSWWLRDQGSNVAAFWTNCNNSATNFPVRATADVLKVGVIDTGFYMNHPDKGTNIVVGKDEFQTYHDGVLTKDSDVTPASSTAPMATRNIVAHGTCTAGEIAAATNNGAGVASVGYDLQVRVYKVQGIWTDGDPLNGYPAGSAVIMDQAIIDAIYDATNDGCKVLNISLGSTNYSSLMQSAVDYAHSHGVVVCAATGNNGVATNFYPAAYNNVVGVGSYELNSSAVKIRSSFTNYGAQLDVLAPGKMIFGLTDPTYDFDGASTAYAPGYEWWQGTSMASPAFVGMLAMIWRFAPALNSDEITSYMLSNSTAAGTGQPNADYGYGYVNVAGTYAKLRTDFPYLVKPTITTGKTAYAAESVALNWSPSAGRSVQYKVERTGTSSASTTQAGTTLTYAGLADGSYHVAITPLSSYNWYDPNRSSAFDFTVDKTAPVISNISYSSNAITWNDTEGNDPHTTMVYLGTDAPQSITGNTFSITPGSLADGGYTFHITEADAVGNTSGNYSYTFSHVDPPAVPILNPAYSTYAFNPYSLTWIADPTAGYQYSLNSGSIVDIPGGSAELTLLEGTNSLQVRSIKGTVTSAWVDTTITYYPPAPAVPVIPAIADASGASNSKTFSWNSSSYASSYEYRLNAGAISTTTGISATVTGLVEGENIVDVRSHNFSGYSGWASGSVTYYPPAPVAPVLPTLAAVSTPTKTFSWTAISGATSYEYRLNGGAPQALAGPVATVAGLSEGSNTIEVRSKNFTGTSAWASKTVTYDPPSPAVPNVPAIADVTGPSPRSATFSWAAVPYATSYEYRLNAGTPGAVTGTSATVSGLLDGVNTVEARSHNFTGYSAWDSSSITYYPVLPGAPSIAVISGTTVPTTSFTWVEAPNATSYEYRLSSSGTVVSTTGASGAVSGLLKGSNTIEVRSRNFTGTSAWASQSVIFTSLRRP